AGPGDGDPAAGGLGLLPGPDGFVELVGGGATRTAGREVDDDLGVEAKPLGGLLAGGVDGGGSEDGDPWPGGVDGVPGTHVGVKAGVAVAPTDRRGDPSAGRCRVAGQGNDRGYAGGF